MWYGKQASPASSTSTVDQQEIIFDDNQLQQQLLHQQQLQLQQPPTNSTTRKTNKRQAGATSRATKRPRNTNSQYARINGTAFAGAGGGASDGVSNLPIANCSNNNKTSGGANAGTTKATSNSHSTGNTKCSAPKRPKLFNHPHQLAPWKSLNHHFLRHADVKYRPEKRMTMAELGNEVLQRRNGWKVHHLVGQITDLIQNELQTKGKLGSLLEIFTLEGAKRIHDLANNCHKLPEQYEALLKSQRSYGTNEFKPELIVTKLDDLLRGDLQRSNMFDDQLRDCRDLIVRITNEHRDRVARITTKFNKRIQL